MTITAFEHSVRRTFAVAVAVDGRWKKPTVGQPVSDLIH
jgi:hypothetical protein